MNNFALVSRLHHMSFGATHLESNETCDWQARYVEYLSLSQYDDVFNCEMLWSISLSSSRNLTGPYEKNYEKHKWSDMRRKNGIFSEKEDRIFHFKNLHLYHLSTPMHVFIYFNV